MGRKLFQNCTNCGARLGAGNHSGHCRPCAMKEMGRRHAQDNADFKRIMEACQGASHEVRGRVRAELNEEHRESEVGVAELIGVPVSARVHPRLQKQEIDGLWREEQYLTALPPLAIQVSNGVVKVAYHNSWHQNHSREDIRRHFEWAVCRRHPDMRVEWLS
jgi:hypothetical protein